MVIKPIRSYTEQLLPRLNKRCIYYYKRLLNSLRNSTLTVSLAWNRNLSRAESKQSRDRLQSKSSAAPPFRKKFRCDNHAIGAPGDNCGIGYPTAPPVAGSSPNSRHLHDLQAFFPCFMRPIILRQKILPDLTKSIYPFSSNYFTQTFQMEKSLFSTDWYSSSLWF